MRQVDGKHLLSNLTSTRTGEIIILNYLLHPAEVIYPPIHFHPDAHPRNSSKDISDVSVALPISDGLESHTLNHRAFVNTRSNKFMLSSVVQSFGALEHHRN